jgi:hypothetical protein
MVRLSLPALVTAGALVGLAACGDSFSAGSGDGGGSDSGTLGDSTSLSDGGDGGAQDSPLESIVPGEASTSDGSVGGPGVSCGAAMSCSGATPVCCLTSNSASCAHQECGCNTQLGCASDSDCQLPAAVCCIGDTKDPNCDTGHFVSVCQAACMGGESQLCDPGVGTIQCLNGNACSTNSGDLQKVDLPPGPPYGVCTN